MSVEPEELDDVDEVRFHRSRHAPPAQAPAAAELECTVNIFFRLLHHQFTEVTKGSTRTRFPELNMSLGTAQTAFRREEYENHMLHA